MLVELDYSFYLSLIGIPFGIFLIVLGFRAKKDKKADRLRTATGNKGISSLKSGRADEFLADYFDYFLMLSGVALMLFGAAAIMEDFFGEEVYSGLLLDVLFFLIAVSVFIICFILNMTGKRADRVVCKGVVVENVLANVRRQTYKIVLKYQIDGKDMLHKVAYSFSRRSVPGINDEIKIIYSRKYEKALTKFERGRYRLIMFGSIVLAIIMGNIFISTVYKLINA